MRSRALASVALLAALVAAGCSEPAASPTGPDQPGPTELSKNGTVTVVVDPSQATLAVGGELQLRAKALRGGSVVSSTSFTWSSSDTTLATVTSTGRVHGRKAGVATITATTQGTSATAAVTLTTATVAPVAKPGGPYSGAQGDRISFSGSKSTADSSALPLRYAWDFGDGGTDTVVKPKHAYAAWGTYTVTLTVTDATGAVSAPATTTARVDPVLVGAGDIASCSATGDEKTALLLDSIPGTVLAAGDNVYENGTLEEYNNCYAPNWGRQFSRTKPAAGNHEYNTPGASGYYAYFGAAAGDPTQGYYSYDLGTWHVVVLNSNIDMAAGSAQEQWLRGDLAATTQPCIMAYWHHPRFSSAGGVTANNLAVKPLWDALSAAGADLVVNGHAHVYERFAKQTPDGVSNSSTGIREIVAGTGGESHGYFRTTLAANSQIRNSSTYGVLKLTLAPSSYTWKFVPIAGKTFTDSGTTTCH